MKKDIYLNSVAATRKYVDDAIKNIEIPEGFSGDYNDLTNKPFYDTREYEDVIIEYDGNTEGRTICSIPAMGITTAYKVADLTAEQLEQYRTSCANGFTLTYLKEDGSTEVVQSSVVYGFMGTSMSLYAGGVGQVFLAVNTFSTEIGHADNYVNEAGIYFKEKTGTNPYKVIKLEFQNTSGDLKIIEPQFLTNSPGIKVKEGESDTSNETSQTYVSRNNAEIFNDTRNMATGQYSHAEGTMTEAHGNYSHAEGNGSIATGEHSHAEGAYTKATGVASHSEGWNTEASGHYSHAEGQTTTAQGMYSHVEGDCNDAIGECSHVEGTYNIAHGDYQHVQGKHAIPDEEGRYAHIVGNGKYAQNRGKDSNAHTLDWDGNAWFQGDVFIKGTSQDDAKKLATEEFVNNTMSNIQGFSGDYNDLENRPCYDDRVIDTVTLEFDGNTEGLLTGGNFISVTDYVRISEDVAPFDVERLNATNTIVCRTEEGETVEFKGTFLKMFSNVYYLSGENNDFGSDIVFILSNMDFHAPAIHMKKGIWFYSNGDRRVESLSYEKVMSGDLEPLDAKYLVNSPGIKKANGAEIFNDYANNVATGEYSHTEGSWTQATGNDSHAEGASCRAIGDQSHAEGLSTIAEGKGSHAEGWGCQSDGEASHAEGNYSKSKGQYSHAEGNYSEAKGMNSHAEGDHTKATGDSQHAQGKYNIEDTENKYAHIVGNGTYQTPSNIHTLDWDGNAWFSGNVSIGTDNKQLATEEFVNNQITSLVDSAPDAMNTLNELANAINNHATEYEAYVATVSNALAGKAPASHTSDTTSHITAAERTAWNAKSNLTLGTTSSTAYRGDYGNTAYTHSQAAHAPSNAQKNSDITKAEIEAKLTGAITSHTHNYVPNTYLSVDGNQLKYDGNDYQACGSRVLLGDGNTITDTSAISTAIGQTNTVDGSVCVVMGRSNKINGYGNHVLGAGNETYSGYNYAIGEYNILGKSGSDYSYYGIAVGISNKIGNVSDTDLATAIGHYNTVNGNYGSAIGYQNTVNGNGSAYGSSCRAESRGSSFGYSSKAYGYYSLALGTYAETGSYSNNTVSGGNSAVCIGYNSKATANYSLALGYSNEATNEYATAIGYSAKGQGAYSAALTPYATASGSYSTAIGWSASATGEHAIAMGTGVTAVAGVTAMGHYNDTSHTGSTSGTDGTALVIGNGTSSAKSNACRITFAGQVIGKAAYASSGADYAEYFEWKDGNLNKEDRVGYFVTMDGEKIRIAKEGDYLLGVISGYPAVIGNNDMEWHGYYVLDEFNRPIKKKYTEIKTYEVINEDHGYSEEELDNMTTEERKKATTKIVEEEVEYEGFIVNPDFDPNKEYIHRADRPEWDAVGMMGVLAVYDDGTCEVNGFCKCNNEGIATACEKGCDSYRVIQRVNEHIVKIVFR